MEEELANNLLIIVLAIEILLIWMFYLGVLANYKKMHKFLIEIKKLQEYEEWEIKRKID